MFSVNLHAHVKHLTKFKVSRVSDSRVRNSRICLMRSRRSLLERSTLFLVTVALSRAAWALPLASSDLLFASAT